MRNISVVACLLLVTWCGHQVIASNKPPDAIEDTGTKLTFAEKQRLLSGGAVKQPQGGDGGTAMGRKVTTPTPPTKPDPSRFPARPKTSVADLGGVPSLSSPQPNGSGSSAVSGGSKKPLPVPHSKIPSASSSSTIPSADPPMGPSPSLATPSKPPRPFESFPGGDGFPPVPQKLAPIRSDVPLHSPLPSSSSSRSSPSGATPRGPPITIGFGPGDTDPSDCITCEKSPGKCDLPDGDFEVDPEFQEQPDTQHLKPKKLSDCERRKTIYGLTMAETFPAEGSKDTPSFATLKEYYLSMLKSKPMVGKGKKPYEDFPAGDHLYPVQVESGALWVKIDPRFTPWSCDPLNAEAACGYPAETGLLCLSEGTYTKRHVCRRKNGVLGDTCKRKGTVLICERYLHCLRLDNTWTNKLLHPFTKEGYACQETKDKKDMKHQKEVSKVLHVQGLLKTTH